MIGQIQPGNESHHHKTQDCKPCDRAVLLGSFTLLLSTWVPFPNKISCFASMCVSSDNSFPSVRQEPGFGPWKGSPFLQQNCHMHEEKFSVLSVQLEEFLHTEVSHKEKNKILWVAEKLDSTPDEDPLYFELKHDFKKYCKKCTAIYKIG